MQEQPKIVTKEEVPSAVKELCERIHTVADGLPTLVFLPNADHSRLYPMVVVDEEKNSYAKQISAFLQGDKLTTPTTTLKQKYELTLEAIHAAADYLPAIVFLPDNDGLHSINLVSETVPDHLKPCYLAVQRAQKTAIGNQSIRVADYTEIAMT